MHLTTILQYILLGIMATSRGDALEVDYKLRVMTYNVRYDSMPDDISVKQTIDSLPKEVPSRPSHYYTSVSEKPWSTRRIHVANNVLLADVDILGGQELLRRQLLDLEELLGNNYAWVGVGRDDGQEEGEYSAIFYKKLVLPVSESTTTLKDWDTFWLSDTPFEVSKYPGAGSIRVATTAHFEGNGGYFTVINTHLDEQSADQRQLGASLILHRAKYETIKTRRPVIVTGDFNSPSNDGAYQIITGQLAPLPLNKTFTERYSWTAQEEDGFSDFICKDLLGETPPQRRSGNYATFTDFVAVDDSSKFERLDYIFAGSKFAWGVESYHVGTNLYDDGIYASDHRPVHTTLLVNEDVELTKQ